METRVGKLIEDEMKRQERKPKWLGDKIGCNRNNIYSIFSRTDLYVQQLWNISRALDHNFFADLAEMLEKESRTDTETQ